MFSYEAIRMGRILCKRAHDGCSVERRDGWVSASFFAQCSIDALNRLRVDISVLQWCTRTCVPASASSGSAKGPGQTAWSPNNILNVAGSILWSIHKRHPALGQNVRGSVCGGAAIGAWFLAVFTNLVRDCVDSSIMYHEGIIRRIPSQSSTQQHTVCRIMLNVVILRC
jgi:hypothetical protein